MFDYQPPPDTPSDVIYTDNDILVVNKPCNLLSVPGRRPEHQDCLIGRIQKRYPEAIVVHRLDMSTSGLMIIARNREAQRQLNRQFEQRLVSKSYLAVVSGQVAEATGSIDLPLCCDWPNRPRQRVDHINGKPSQTAYKILSYDAITDSTRVELKPVTGRTHQLRVHMLALGHPILGDDLYADELALTKADRLLLHANLLEIIHPTTLKPMIFKKEAPF